MNLNFSKEQFITLLEAIHAAAHISPSPEIEELENEMLSAAVAQGLEGIVFEGDRLMLGNIITQPLHDRINEYEEAGFWRALAEEMADKDLRTKLGNDAVSDLTDEEYFEKTADLVADYDEEFKAHGVDRLTLDYQLFLKKYDQQ